MEQRPLKNTIKKGGDYDFVTPPPGVNVYGLVNVKNCTLRAFKGEGEVDGFNFVFRLKDNEHAFLNHKVTARLGKNSNLYKTLQLMTKFALPEEVSENQAFQVMQSLIGKWFEIAVKVDEGKTPDETGELPLFAKVISNQITPVAGSDSWPHAREFFAPKEKKLTANEPATFAKANEYVSGGFDEYGDGSLKETVSKPAPKVEESRAKREQESLSFDDDYIPFE